MARQITASDFTRWYQKVNVLRKQNGIGASTITEATDLNTSKIVLANRAVQIINGINTARNLHTLLQQSTGAISTAGVAADRVAEEELINNIESGLLALLKTCINIDKNTVVQVGNNISSGNNYFTGNNVNTGNGARTGNNISSGNNIHSGNNIYY